MQTIAQALEKLNRSSFRSSFHLGENDRKYVTEKGIDTIRAHAADFVKARLAPKRRKTDADARSSRLYRAACYRLLLPQMSV